VTRLTLTTTEAAWLFRQDRRSFKRWATAHGITPLRRQLIGNTWVTLWAVADLRALSRRLATGAAA